MTNATTAVDSERASDDTPKCPACDVPLVPVTGQPGAELGTWYEHPGLGRRPMIGHVIAVLVPDEALAPKGRP